MTLPDEMSTRASGEMLGVLSVHLDGSVCRVGCEFCYLGARRGEAGAPDVDLMVRALERLPYREVAVALSEPAEAARPALARLLAAAHARARPVAVTTTLAVAAEAGLLDGVDRVSLSVDPRKGRVVPARIGQLARVLHQRGAQAGRPVEVVLVVSATTPEFAARLVDGLLAELVDLPDVDAVAWNAIKPPPPWCGRAFWLGALARLRPLLERALDRRLYLDCWVAARLLALGGCPARPDLSPGPGGVGVAFRSCVYQAAPDFIARDADELAARLRGFRAPDTCPFPY